ncbi:MAG: carbon storage regulator [Candidatus Saccharimonas sp.]|nr:carbon storage regulator [Planctomycetaceae bacterium]
MRVYTRGVDECLVIGNSVQVSILEVQTDCVRLAIIDPDASPAYREEILYLPSDDGDCDLSDNFLTEYDPSLELSDNDSRLAFVS